MIDTAPRPQPRSSIRRGAAVASSSCAHTSNFPRRDAYQYNPPAARKASASTTSTIVITPGSENTANPTYTTAKPTHIEGTQGASMP